jgi:hypothetical protein
MFLPPNNQTTNAQSRQRRRIKRLRDRQRHQQRHQLLREHSLAVRRQLLASTDNTCPCCHQSIADASQLVFAHTTRAAKYRAHQGMGRTRNYSQLSSIQARENEQSAGTIKCGECHCRETERENQELAKQSQRGPCAVRRRLHEYVYKRKLSIGGCCDCARRFTPTTPRSFFHFDHLPQYNKVASIADMISRRRPLALIAAEIAKCELVCMYCHNKRTAERRSQSSISTTVASSLSTTAQPSDTTVISILTTVTTTICVSSPTQPLRRSTRLCATS